MDLLLPETGTKGNVSHTHTHKHTPISLVDRTPILLHCQGQVRVGSAAVNVYNSSLSCHLMQLGE